MAFSKIMCPMKRIKYYLVMEMFTRVPLKMVKFMEKANISIKMVLSMREIFITGPFGASVR